MLSDFAGIYFAGQRQLLTYYQHQSNNLGVNSSICVKKLSCHIKHTLRCLQNIFTNKLTYVNVALLFSCTMQPCIHDGCMSKRRAGAVLMLRKL